eukprot:COSAG03_NODE_18369_length_356_cov_1.603113_1_plen_47_part_01
MHILHAYCAGQMPAGVLESIMSACREFETQLVWCVCRSLCPSLYPLC